MMGREVDTGRVGASVPAAGRDAVTGRGDLDGHSQFIVHRSSFFVVFGKGIEGRIVKRDFGVVREIPGAFAPGLGRGGTSLQSLGVGIGSRERRGGGS